MRSGELCFQRFFGGIAEDCDLTFAGAYLFTGFLGTWDAIEATEIAWGGVRNDAVLLLASSAASAARKRRSNPLDMLALLQVEVDMICKDEWMKKQLLNWKMVCKCMYLWAFNSEKSWCCAAKSETSAWSEITHHIKKHAFSHRLGLKRDWLLLLWRMIYAMWCQISSFSAVQIRKFKKRL